MHVSETFSKVIGVALLLAMSIAALVFVAQFIPPSRVHAQNAGTTGTFTTSQIAFNNATSIGPSVVFKNIGQSSHWLTYCIVHGSGNAQVALEQSFDGVNNWAPMAVGIIANGASGCATIQAGGYFQNVRANIIALIGSGGPRISAWYNASSGPTSFAPPAFTSGGNPASPLICNGSASTVSVANGATQILGLPSTLLPNSAVYICAYQISFAAVPTGGAVTFEYGTGSNCATGLTPAWVINTTASTPQIINSPASATPLFTSGSANELCLANTSGANLVVSYSVVSE
jgi:hypothetical protein